MNQPVRKYSPPEKKKRNTSRWLKKWIAGLVAIVIVVELALNFQKVQAVFDETNSVAVNDSTVEDGTLLIGSHLIYVGSMTDEIYKQAVDSQSQSGQYNIYYKSEITPGVWYDISSASSLDDISNAGIPVETSVITALRVTHHTKSDGITYDLRTGQSVCIFDNPDPYKVENLPEMEPLKKQYDMKVQMSDSDRSKVDKRNMDLIYKVFSKDYKTAETTAYDESLKALQKYYESVATDDDKKALAAQVLKVMSKVDASRRLIVLQQLKDTEVQNLITEFSKQYSEGDDTEPADSSMVTAAGEALQNLETSYNEYSANVLEEGTTVLSKVEYNLSNNLINAAKSGNNDECTTITKNLIALNNIMDEVIGDGAAEAEFIESELVPLADEAFLSALKTAESDALKSVTDASTEASKSVAYKSQKSEVDGKRTELQFILRAKITRLSTEDGISYVTQRLNGAGKFSDAVVEDGFEAYGNELVDAYVAWLQENLQTLNNAKGIQNGSVSSLEEERDDLEAKRLAALDNNNLAEANEIQAEIDKKTQEIDDKTKELNNIISSNTATDAEKADAQSQLGTNGDLALLEQLKKNALDNISAGTLDTVGNTITAISALSTSLPNQVLSALQEIYEALSQRMLTDSAQLSKLKELAELIERLLADSLNNYVPDVTESDMSSYVGNFFDDSSSSDSDGDNLLDNGKKASAGSDDSSGGSTSKELQNQLNKLSDKDLAVALVGMDMYTKATNSEMTSSIVAAYAQKLSSAGSKYVYEKYSTDLTTNYVSADTLARNTGYRTIFYKSLQSIVLQKGNDHYEFKAFTAKVVTDKTTEMSSPAGFQKVVYIPSDFVETEFNRTTVYLENCNYAVLIDEDGLKEAEKFFDYLMGMEG